MKKSLLVAACLVLGAQAHASKARMTALGQSTNGSNYIADFRGVFLNPAWINEMGTGMVNFEMGGTASGSTPNAEGGFIHQMAGWNYGVQLGATSTFDSVISKTTGEFTTTNGLAFVNPKNTVTLMFGGGEGLKYGATLLYGSTVDKTASSTTAVETSKKSSTIELSGGVYNEMFDAYVHLGTGGTAKTVKSLTATTSQEAKLEGGLTAQVGGGYNLSKSMKVFADINMWSAKADDGASTAVVKNKYSYSSYMVGFSNLMEMSKEARFFYSLGFMMSNYKNTDEVASTDTKEDMMNLPLVVGVEADAMSWLTLRGSVSQKVLLDDNKNGGSNTVTDSHAVNTTAVGAGLGIHFGKMTFDATLGGATSGNGKFNGVDMFTNGSLNYVF